MKSLVKQFSLGLVTDIIIGQLGYRSNNLKGDNLEIPLSCFFQYSPLYWKCSNGTFCQFPCQMLFCPRILRNL